MQDLNYVVRIYENKFFGRYVGKNKKNVDLFNGSINISGTGYFVFDLRELDLARFGANAEERNKLSSLAQTIAEDVIGVRDAYNSEVIYARLHEWDTYSRKKTPAMGVFVFSQEERKVAVALEGYSEEPILITDSIYACPPKGDGKNRPIFFVSSYDVSEAA